MADKARRPGVCAKVAAVVLTALAVLKKVLIAFDIAAFYKDTRFKAFGLYLLGV